LKSTIVKFLIIFFLFVMVIFTGCAQKKEFTYTGYLIGSPCEINFICSNGGIAGQTVAEIDEELHRLDSLLNYFSPKSLVSEINRNHKAKLDKDIIYLFALSDSISRLTGGVFDISIAPLMEIWGFYSNKGAIPAIGDIENAKKRVDFKRIIIKGDSIFTPVDMKIDLGGIAQGFAADRVGKIIQKYEIFSAIINIGGEILAIGESPAGRPWHVGIRNPRGEGVIESVELKDGALSTSGDYENFFIVNGQRYPHILNPKTGSPAQRFASVTIFAKETAFADGMATSVAIMGPEQGRKFLDSLHLKGIIYYEDNTVLKRLVN